ncbi:26S proteasome regulatory subunit [Hyphodiscus hymeniophilus]|uniref:26S proteasome regulatory subunit n=1 Tax=Hyphodiscus hymeniophilus TaxID=353542 RepID=A0A9P6VDH2_9HELO|nr:26S proteasome regulatory subunit [Hyphodiscus hymeniophilus]
MALTEIVQCHFPLSLEQPCTPPISPDLLSSQHAVPLNNVQQLVEIVEDTVAKKIKATLFSKYACFHTPTESPPISPLPVTFQDIKNLLLAAIEAKSPVPTAIPETLPTGVIETHNEVVTQSLKPQYKKIDEVVAFWDEKTYKYKIVESQELPAEADKLDSYVFVIRGRIDKKTTETTFYIDVKSECLRDALRNILKDAHAVNTKENKLSVEQKLLYHYLPELESSQSWHGINTLDQNSAKLVGLLVDYLRETYADTTENLTSIIENGEITYNLLWALFKPNEPVFTTCHGTHKPRCVKYDYGEEKISKSGSKYWNIECRYKDFDGNEFGDVSIELRIPKFRGVKRIDLLEAFPLQYHPDYFKVKAELIENGQKFVSLIGSHHRQYNGTAFYMNKGVPVELNVNGRIMIDAAFFQRINPNYSRLKITDPADSIPELGLWDMFELVTDDDQSGIAESAQLTIPNVELSWMNEDDFLICCPTVLGFSFADKQWVEFAVANIQEIRWSSGCFDGLVIPDKDREVIMALVEARNGRALQDLRFIFDDIVVGKGRGLNILLHGYPGLGKTLTAEAAAEHLKRPLYSVRWPALCLVQILLTVKISAGELSINAADLEAQLSQIFQIAGHWGAILLLDEADVYLERRSNQDLVRNGLVSVFLRKLEYCEGIIFLTTNRVAQFDEAILSRVHLTLRYDVLDRETKTKIWTQFLNRSPTAQGLHTVSSKQLEGLVSHRLNGRQIKNIVATAHAMATKEKCPIKIEHLAKAVAINERFVREFYGKGKTDGMYH